MTEIRTPPRGDEPLPGTVDVGHHVPGLAVVSLRGEHDLSTEPELTQALEYAAAHSNVVVDLSECSFIDSTVIKALIKTAHALHARGEQLALVIPPEQRQVARIAQMTQLGEFFPIHTARGAALTSLESFAQRTPPESTT
jgi:anti-sigma B factor antagonist